MKAQLSILAVAGLLVATGVAAQTAEEQVEQRVLSYYQSLNDGDAEAWESLFSAQYHGYFGGGASAFRANHATAAQVQSDFDRGLTYQMGVRELAVTVYGHTAVATYIQFGQLLANGSVFEDSTHRTTTVWVREGQSWNLAHSHNSLLSCEVGCGGAA